MTYPNMNYQEYLQRIKKDPEHIEEVNLQVWRQFYHNGITPETDIDFFDNKELMRGYFFWNKEDTSRVLLNLGNIPANHPNHELYEAYCRLYMIENFIDKRLYKYLVDKPFSPPFSIKSNYGKIFREDHEKNVRNAIEAYLNKKDRDSTIFFITAASALVLGCVTALIGTVFFIPLAGAIGIGLSLTLYISTPFIVAAVVGIIGGLYAWVTSEPEKKLLEAIKNEAQVALENQEQVVDKLDPKKEEMNMSAPKDKISDSSPTPSPTTSSHSCSLFHSLKQRSPVSDDENSDPEKSLDFK